MAYDTHNCARVRKGKKVIMTFQQVKAKFEKRSYRTLMWKKHGWMSLFYIAFNYPVKKINNIRKREQAYRDFFCTLPLFIPSNMVDLKIASLQIKKEICMTRKLTRKIIVSILQKNAPKKYNKICEKLGKLRK